MANYIKTLKEDNGDITYPQTKASAVLLNNNSDLETELANYVTAEEIASTADVDLRTTILNMIYPVGSIYASVTMSTAAQVMTAFGGTWVAWGAGRVPVGVDTSDTDFNTAGKTGGEKTHTLTSSEIPSHRHSTTACGTRGKAQSDTSGSSGYAWNADSGSYTGYAGGGGAHNNLQPYITCYMYKRTA